MKRNQQNEEIEGTLFDKSSNKLLHNVIYEESICANCADISNFVK